MNTLDGVAPGKVVEGGGFRVYSRSWAEGDQAVVFVDSFPNNGPEPLAYQGTVQPGGFIEIAPDPADLPAASSAYYVSVAEDMEGTAASSWVNALKIEPGGTTSSPLPVTNEEDASCGGAGTECSHPILPGQTWQGAWGQAGDTDYFSFSAGAGTRVRVTLDRADGTLPPQHPDAPAPELLLIRPDGVVVAASEPLSLDATGTSLASTLTMDGRYSVAARTAKGSGSYLLALTETAEGGSGSAGFGYTRERTHIATSARPSATFEAPLLDGFGHPLVGAPVTWEQGSECPGGGFCGTVYCPRKTEARSGVVPQWKLRRHIRDRISLLRREFPRVCVHSKVGRYGVGREWPSGGRC